jgi:hypothetical protein
MSVPSVDVIPVYAPKRQVHEVHMVDQPFRRFTLTETSTSAYIHTYMYMYTYRHTVHVHCRGFYTTLTLISADIQRLLREGAT